MKLTQRQKRILTIVQEKEPISGDNIAAELGLTRATLRSDLSVLTMLGMLDAKPKVGYNFVKDAVTPLLYDRLFERKVDEIMRAPRFIEVNSSVQDAITSMFLYDTGSLYVLDDRERLAGVISRKDLLRVAMNGGGNQSYPVAMIMTRMPNLITAYPDETILDAAYKMMTREIDSLPVVDRANPSQVVGRISKTMITHFFTQVGLEIRGGE